jgi:plasminogen activator inhibitor 1 RNA-binding protein
VTNGGFGGEEAAPEHFEGRRGGRGAYRQRGAPMGGGGGGMEGAGGYRGRRQFDRVSGSDKTGIKPHEKKDGYGKGNWGTNEDELVGESEGLNATGESDKEVKKPEPVEPTPEELERRRLDEIAASQLTYEEYKALQNKTKKTGQGFKIRQPKVDNTLQPMKSKLDESTDNEEIIVEKRPSKKQVLDINVEFIHENAGGAPGGDFGGGRGRGDFRGGRGGNRGGDFRGGRGSRGSGSGAPRGGGGGFAGGRGGRGGRGAGGAFSMDNESFPELG